MYSAQGIIFAVLMSSTLVSLGVWSCSTEEPEPAEISGHVWVLDGVPHAKAADRGERYCHLCHGIGLAGGADVEPSCYQCHGKNWSDRDASVTVAPADHTSDHQGFLHHPDHGNPEATCSECHGADLQGDSDNGANYPGCYSCHAALWQE